MALEALSPSRAEDFKACPQLYKFRSIDRLHEQTTIQQARGTTAHLALQRLFDSPPAERTPERLYALFRESWTELRALPEYGGLFEGTEEERSWGLDCLKLLANYFATERPESIEPIDREMDMLEDLGGITIRGILDRIDRRPDGALTITDYKTGAAPSERYALSAFFALKIYALLIRTRTGETPAEVRLLYLRGPTVYRLAIDDGHTRRCGAPTAGVVGCHRPGHRDRPLPTETRAAVLVVLVQIGLSGVRGGVRTEPRPVAI
jgi:putative RecB family exonuclease